MEVINLQAPPGERFEITTGCTIINLVEKGSMHWRVACSFLMVVALAVTILGSLSFFSAGLGDGPPMNGMGDGAFFLVWVFGLTGIFLCYLAGAAGRRTVAILGFGWSSLALLWRLIVYQCAIEEFCTVESSENTTLLVICIAVICALLFYDRKKENFPSAVNVFTKVIAWLLIILWACSLAVFVVSFNKPLSIQIKRSSRSIMLGFGPRFAISPEAGAVQIKA
ncbi:hypothetical protein [Noviherbaspirillum humi]|uniref:hypothetical protein n=1 Tax=Noviherbaspirillum humi TaxID=1688639 RepID=UPI0011605DE1|nr:hypothetical protein [Noviherbaspirillum humi]